MIVTLDDATRIRGTEHCWQIELLHKTKDGELWKPAKYYQTLIVALHEAAQREIRLAPASSLPQIAATLRSVADKYGAILDGMEDAHD